MSRVIVKNLPFGIKEEQLRQLFSDNAVVTDCSLKYTKDGVFRKFAFVGFRTEAEADAAVVHFDKTFVNTSRIQVSIANNLGESYKNRPWSKHTKNIELNSLETKKTELSKNKKSFENELLKGLEGNVQFQEFLDVHKQRSSKSAWSNDIVLGTGSLEKQQEDSAIIPSKKESPIKSVEASLLEQPKPKLSDLEYLKSKMTTDFVLSDDDDDEDEPAKDERGAAILENEVEKSDVKYCIKMKGLPSNIKESRILEFFKPIVPLSVRLSKSRPSSRMATVEFLSEKDQEQALRRNKNFIGTNKVFLHKLNETTSGSMQNSEKTRAWELKAASRDGEVPDISESGMLYVRNLAYCCTEEDLKTAFNKFGPADVTLPVDGFTKKIKGFAIVSFNPPENAVKAFAELDGTVFLGRMLHILPSKPKKENLEITDDMSYKKKKELQLKANASSAHNWNALFVGGSAVADLMARRYGKTKDEILTQVGKKDSIGVRMALGETQIVAEIRQFLLDNGVSLDAFSQPSCERSKTVMLVKHLPAGTSGDELRELFEKHGTVGRVVLPPGGLTAIVEYVDQSEARNGFKALAYTKFKHLPLYLEWAPVNVFVTSTQTDHIKKAKEESDSESGGEADDSSECTLFVKNLNFSTTEESLKNLFQRIGKIRNVIIARKKDAAHPGKLLSMGYGFIEYKLPDSAKQALKVLQHTMLDDHQLELKFTNRTTTLKHRGAKELSGEKMKQKNSTKILIRNVPFEAKESEVRQLFSVFGELKTVRMPKKVSGTGKHRGFAFVDFLTKEDAKRAFEALCHSTHLYGRRLVLEWADTESESLQALRIRTADHFVDDDASVKRLKKSSLLDRLDSGAMD